MVARAPDPSVVRLLVVLLVAAQASACKVDLSGLGETIAFDIDSAAPDTLASDTGAPAVLDSGSSEAAVDATVDVADTDVADVADVVDASDASDASDTADTYAPDTRDVGSDTSVAMDTAYDTFDAATDTAVSCSDPGAIRYLGHCYFLLATPASQAGGEIACKAAGGAHLASITSAGEQAVVAGLGTGDRWIGLVKDDAAPMAKTSFRWLTGESAQVYDGWEATEPNGGESCARMKPTNVWGDFTCTSPFPPICERE